MGKTYIDPLLTNVAKGYRPLTHINELILPPQTVKKPTGKIGVYGADNLRIISSVKAPEGETPVFRMDVSQEDAYTLVHHALKSLASDEMKENDDKPFDTERDRAEALMDLLSTGREYALAAYLKDNTNITQTVTLSGTGQWGGSADAPITDIATAVNTVGDAVGVAPHMVSLVMGNAVWRKLILLPEIRESIGANYGLGLGRVSKEALAAALGVRQIITGEAFYNSAADGQTATLASIWGKDAWAIYIPTQPKLKEICFGYTVKRKAGPWVDKFYDQDREGTWVRCHDEFDQFIMSNAAAYLIKDAIA